MKYYGYLSYLVLDCEAESKEEARIKLLAKLIELIENDDPRLSMFVGGGEDDQLTQDGK